MALFENFPYTNLHQLNLDWLIDELNRIREMGVISVNGETGEVILYQDPDVIYPPIDSNEWKIMRLTDGLVSGIHFNRNGIAYIVSGATLDRIYTANHPPDYPVTSVNGLTGAVTLYTEQYIHLPDLTNDQIVNWNIYRKLNGMNTGIQFDNNGNAYIMRGTNRDLVYTSNNSPDLSRQNILLPDVPSGTSWSVSRFVGSNNLEIGLELDQYGNATIIKGNEEIQIYSTYNVPSDFDQPTASILELVEPVESGTQWGIVRSVNNELVGILFVYNNVTQLYDGYIKQGNSLIKLLTINDIPSSSGVVSVNGMTGVVSLDGSTINIDGNTAQSIKNYIDNSLSDVAEQSMIAYVENGNTSTDNIPAYHYLIWNNGMYRSLVPISAGDTLVSGTNVEPIDHGLGNAIRDHLPVTMVQGLTANTSHTYSVPSGSTHFVIFTSARPTCDAIILLNCQSSGLLSIIEIYKGANISFDGSVRNALTVTCNTAYSTGVYLSDMTLIGDYIRNP